MMHRIEPFIAGRVSVAFPLEPIRPDTRRDSTRNPAIPVHAPLTGDSVELSAEGAALSNAQRTQDRVERIAGLRHEIQQGTFETPERIAGTIDRLLELI